MILELIHQSSDYWSSYDDKLTFDGINKLIIVNPSVTSLDIRADLYSEWIWWLGLRDNTKYFLAMRYTGIDPIGGGKFTGDSYFLTNGWKLIIDLTKIKVTGILFSDDYDTAYYDANLVPQYPATVSSLVNTVNSTQTVVTGDISTVPTAQQNATAAWAHSKALTVGKFIALK